MGQAKVSQGLLDAYDELWYFRFALLQGLIQSIRGVYVISALALPIRPDGAGNEGEEEDAAATALNYAHLKYVCKVSISTLCKKFIVRFPIANSIKCFEFSSLLFLFFIFYRCSATSTAALADCVCFSFRCWLHYFFFFCILSRSLFVFVFVLFQFQFAFAISFCVYQAFIARSCSCAISVSLSLTAVSVFDCAFSAAAAAAFQCCCCCCFIFNTYNLLIVSLLVFAYAKCFVRFSVSFSRLHCELCSLFSLCVCVCECNCNSRSTKLTFPLIYVCDLL